MVPREGPKGASKENKSTGQRSYRFSLDIGYSFGQPPSHERHP